MKKATYQGRLVLMGLKVSCAILEDGTRVLVDSSVATALGEKGGDAYWDAKEKGEIKLPECLSSTCIRPYISDELIKELKNPISYININGNETVGIEAMLLPKICDVWISAKNSGKLTKSQELTADKAYMLMKGFAAVGITALIDEATGYQYDELQKTLNNYVSMRAAFYS